MQILKEEIRAAIVNAATEEFLLKGFSSTSIRSISNRAKISKSNLYNYFPDKETLLAEICGPLSPEIHRVLDSFEQYESGKLFTEEKFLEEFAGMIAGTITQLIRNFRSELLISYSLKEGEPTSGVREKIIIKLETHFQNQFPSLSNTKHPLVLRMIVSTLLDGIIGFARQYHDLDLIEKCLRVYLLYHLIGIAHFC